MGREKELLEIRGSTLVERIHDALCPIADHALVITEHPENYRLLGLPVVSDPGPHQGALVGIRTALRWTTHWPVVLAAVDMPFVEPVLIRALLERVNDSPASIACWVGELQPFPGVFQRNCWEPIESLVSAGETRVRVALDAMRVSVLPEHEIRSLDGPGNSYLNPNTPQDLDCLEPFITF